MIDYNILAASVPFYEGFGYRQIEVPWTVPEEVSRITAPQWAQLNTLVHNQKSLVGSGEQSFVYMMIKGQLPSGAYQTITPCFRDERVDILHLKHFIKNELIDTGDTRNIRVLRALHSAKLFFSKYLEGVKTERTDEGYDLVWRGYELGSYGVREFGHLKWVYGTGVAEPRLSSLVKIQEYGISQEENRERNLR